MPDRLVPQSVVWEEINTEEIAVDRLSAGNGVSVVKCGCTKDEETERLSVAVLPGK